VLFSLSSVFRREDSSMLRERAREDREIKGHAFVEIKE
jgi:hypothetical protein